MEVLLVDELTGSDSWALIEDTTVPGDVKRQAQDAFGHNADHIDLIYGDVVLTDEPDALRVLEEGVRLNVALNGRVFLQRLQGGLRFADIPPWAQSRQDCALAAVSADPRQFEHFPEEVKCDRGIVEAAVGKMGHLLQYAPLKDQKDHTLLALAARSWRTNHTQAVLNSRVFVLEALRYRTVRYSNLSRSLQRDLEVALAAVAGGTCVQSIDSSVSSHPDVVHTALSLHPVSNWEYLPVTLRCNLPNLLLAILSTPGKVAGAHHLRSAGCLRKDREVVRRIVSYNGVALCHAHPRMWQDEELLNIWFAQDDRATIPTEMLEHRTVVTAALAHSRSIERLPRRFHSDRGIVLAYLKSRNYPSSARAADKICIRPWADDREIVLAAVRRAWWYLWQADASMWCDAEIFALATRNGTLRDLVSCANSDIIDNWDVGVQIVAADCSLIYKLGRGRRRSRDFVLQAMQASANPSDLPNLLSRGVLRDPNIRKVLLSGPWSPMPAAVRATFFAALPDGCDDEMLAAVQRTPASFSSFYSPARPCDHAGIALAAASQCFDVLALCSARLRAHRPLVLACVDLCGEALRWVGPDLAGDREVVRRACAAGAFAVRFASVKLKSDPEFVEGLLGTAGVDVLRHVPELWGDEQVASAAVALSAGPLRGCAGWQRWCDDEGVMTRAAQRDLRSLRHVSSRLLNDERLAGQILGAVSDDAEFVFKNLAAHTHHAFGRAWLKVQRRLQGCVMDRALVLAYATEVPGILWYAHETLCADREVVLAAAANEAATALSFASTTLRQDREFVADVVQCRASATGVLREAKCLNNDRALFLAALAKGESLSHASDCLRRDPMVLAAVAQHSPGDAPPPAVRCVSKDNALNDYDAFLDAVKKDGRLLKDVPEHMFTTELVREAVLGNGIRLEFVQGLCHRPAVKKALRQILKTETWLGWADWEVSLFEYMYTREENLWNWLTDMTLAEKIVRSHPPTWKLLPKNMRSRALAEKALVW